MSTTQASEVESEIKQLIRDLCPGNPDSMSDQSHLSNDLGYHSLALVELAFAIEDKFDLDPIDQATAKGIQTVDDVVGYVTSKMAERAELEEA